MPTLRTARLTAAVLAIPLLLGTLGACGATDDAPAADDAASGGTETFETFEDYQLAFASCMRDQGVDMPDPNADGSIEAQSGDGFMEAAQTCQDELGEPPAAPGAGPSMSSEEARAEDLEIAACFRDNGYDVPDPQPGESISVPMDAPVEIFEECAPNGIGGSTGVGAS
jgi:hypothetical protein